MIPADRAHLHTAAVTDPGRRGKNNEDRYAVLAHHLGPRDSTPSLLAIVADGVGGHRAGEVAAQIAVQTISQVVARSDGKRPLETLRQAFQSANRSIYSQASEDIARKGMSTTAACAWIIGDRLYIASVGDSRIYLLRDGEVHQLTTDHTWVQEALEAGIITPEEARHHPNAHVIRRHLGSLKPVEPDFRLKLDPDESDAQAEGHQGMNLQPGDQLLVCTDGLTDLVETEEIAGVLQARGRDQAVKELVDLANARGGHDNITIVLLKIHEALTPSKRIRKSNRSRLAFVSITLISLFLIVGIFLGSLFWFGGRSTPTPTPGLSPAPVLQPQNVPGNLPGIDASPTAPSPTGASFVPSPSPSKEPVAGSTEQLSTFTPWPTSTSAP